MRARPFELRYVDAPPRLAPDLPEPSPRLRNQFSPSGTAGRGLTTSTMYNRAGQLV